MATRPKISTSCPIQPHNAFETFNADYSCDAESLISLPVAETDNEDAPLVFICEKCKLLVGDSLSWEGSDDEQNHIHLKRVTNNVLVSKGTRLHQVGKGVPCVIVDLVCRGCQSVLGMMYKSTPKSMDHKRFTHCFIVAKIDSYMLGSGSQMCLEEPPGQQPVTLEFREDVERLLVRMKMMAVSMAHQVDELERPVKNDA
ncbi:protein Mis18-alpha [Stigmatopora argus]